MTILLQRVIVYAAESPIIPLKVTDDSTKSHQLYRRVTNCTEKSPQLLHKESLIVPKRVTD